MAKTLWNKSEAHGLKKQVAAHLREPYRCADGTRSPAQSWLNAAELCWRYQLDIESPPETATKRVEALRAAGEWAELNEAYRLEGLNFEHEREIRAMARWTAMRKWASQ